MFESDLKNEKTKLKELKSTLNYTYISYKHFINDFNTSFSKAGYAENFIDTNLKNFENIFETSLKGFRNNIQEIIKSYLEEIKKKESFSLSYIEEYKSKAIKDYNDKLESLFVIKEEF